jgi:hypothetical protein
VSLSNSPTFSSQFLKQQQQQQQKTAKGTDNQWRRSPEVKAGQIPRKENRNIVVDSRSQVRISQSRI